MRKSGGPLLITMRNNTEHVLTLATSETFVTLVFFRTLSAATFPHNNAPLRSDILFADMEQKTAEYVKKVAKILQDANLESEFRRKVEAANAPMSLKVMASLKRANFRRVRYYLLQSILWGAITLIATAPLFWNTIKPWLHNNIFDTQVLGAWMASIMAVLFGLSQLIKK